MKKNKLDFAKKLLSSGELVIFPAETVFGLGADATNDNAVKAIFKVKDSFNILFINDHSDFNKHMSLDKKNKAKFKWLSA